MVKLYSGTNFSFIPLLLRFSERRVKIKHLSPFLVWKWQGFQQSFEQIYGFREELVSLGMRKIVLLLCLLSQLSVKAQIEWQQSFGSSSEDRATSVKQTNDGGFIISGWAGWNDGDVSESYGNYDYWILKLSTTGIIEWQKSYGGSGRDYANDIALTTDGGYIIAGSSESNDGVISENHGDHDYWIVKISDNGEVQWEQSFGGTHYESANSIEQTSDGGYIIAGQSSSNDGDVSGHHGPTNQINQLYDYWIIKTDSTGTIQWQNSYGGTSSEIATCIRQSSDGGYIVSGTSESEDGDVSINFGYTDYWIVKLDSLGAIEWEKALGSFAYDEAHSIQQTNDGGFVVAGGSANNDWDYRIIKFDSGGNILWDKYFGGTSIDVAHSIQQTTEGGFIVGGYSGSNNGDISTTHGSYDCWLIKLDSAGDLKWQHSFGGLSHDIINCVQQTNDYGFVFVGTSLSNDQDVSGHHGVVSGPFALNDYWVVKLGFATDIKHTPKTEINTSLYPNPTTSTLTIQNASGLYHLSDITGKTLLSGLASGETFTLDISALSSGVYFLTLSEGGHQVVRKVVKQ